MGIAELLIVVPVALIFSAVPVATLVLAFLVYKKLNAIEKKIGG